MLKMCLFCVAYMVSNVYGTLITSPPTNTSAAVGTDAFLTCLVSNKGTDKVKWRKEGDTETLTADSVSVKSNRYKVTGTNNNYNLTITSVTVQDEGQYICEAGDTGSGPTVSRKASLSVVALPTNLSVYWSTPPVEGRTANLTCRATYGRPPPTLTWFKDELPYNPLTPTTSNVNSQGYGDAYSTLYIPINSQTEGRRFRCQTDYPGWTRAKEYTITTHLTGLI
ncbi:hypothetical protein LOTGIDRAFT_166400 [Lottia gigantea]|uniref:Ig-like domain-containing protein n=1 Tax=Lottia gigantea TaxID=225164 RepID=V4BF59_LOTGI|nr:hypothetical protein LOTGIDRAFT_166400 [Lottia gigantea]ESO87519.1 hypothetical protein LOTGIDRAFT_166400 [Lottia gigantea]